MPEIIKEKVVYDGSLQLEEAELRQNGKTFSRLRVNREDGSAMLMLNSDSGKVILTRQFRYAIAGKTNELILEIPAGKVDKGYEPEETAVKEIREETGYQVKKEDLVHICSCYISPGYTSEKLHLYYVEIGNQQKVADGGGLDSENEDIKLVELTLDSFFSEIDRGSITDAKTIMAGLWLRNKMRTEVLPSPH